MNLFTGTARVNYVMVTYFHHEFIQWGRVFSDCGSRSGEYFLTHFSFLLILGKKYGSLNKIQKNRNANANKLILTAVSMCSSPSKCDFVYNSVLAGEL